MNPALGFAAWLVQEPLTEPDVRNHLFAHHRIQLLGKLLTTHRQIGTQGRI